MTGAPTGASTAAVARRQYEDQDGLRPTAGVLRHRRAWRQLRQERRDEIADDHRDDETFRSISPSWPREKTPVAGFYNATASGAGFTSLTFTLKGDGNTLVSKTFTTVAAADAFFTNNAAGPGIAGDRRSQRQHPHARGQLQVDHRCGEHRVLRPDHLSATRHRKAPREQRPARRAFRRRHGVVWPRVGVQTAAPAFGQLPNAPMLAAAVRPAPV